MAKKCAEDMEEIKKSLNYMSDELSKMVKKKKKQDLVSLINETRQLKTIQEKDKKIEEHERRLDELEQYTRMNDKVRSVTTHHSYARVTARDKEREDIPSGELHSLEQVIFSTAKTSP